MRDKSAEQAHKIARYSGALLGLLAFLAMVAVACSGATLATPTTGQASPTGTMSLTPTPSATATQRKATLPDPSVTPTATPSPSASATRTPTPEPTPSPTQPPTTTPSATPTWTPTDTPTPSPQPTASFTPTPDNDPGAIQPREGESILAHNQVIGDYGRGFDLAPSRQVALRKLGHTAFFRDAQEYLHGNEEREGILSRAAALDALNGPAMGAIPAIFLIYEGAAVLPNTPQADFFIGAPELYQHIAGVDYWETHIEPFVPQSLGHPFMIFLDHQLGYGGHQPVTRAVEGMLPLLSRYPNLHFFVDPEFRVTQEQKEAHPPGENLMPGIPVGYVDAEDINQAQRLIQAYVQEHGLASWRLAEGGTAEVILGIHQFQDLNIGRGTPHADQRTMIVGKEHIQQVPGVTLVFDYDGVHPERYGGAAAKYERYRAAMDPDAYPSLMNWAFPGIKVFPPNPYWTPERYDVRPFTLAELAGQEAIPDVGGFGPIHQGYPPLPRVIIIT